MKKICIFILAAALLFVLLSPSCAKSESGGTEAPTAQAENPGGGETPKETEPERHTPNLPDIKFGGYEFRAYISTNNVYGPFDLAVAEETGDTINDSIYRRNRYLEDKYDVVFKQTEINGWDILQNTFKKSVMSGSDDFDLGMLVERHAFFLAADGYLLSAEQMGHLDLARPWYNRDMNGVTAMNGRHYLIFSDECTNMYGLSIALLFNKKIVSDLGLESPYGLVKSGAWTYGKFFDMCRSAVADLDGDGNLTDRDRYGVLSQDNWLPTNFWVSAGVEMVVKDAEGMFRLNLEGNEKLMQALDTAREGLFGGTKIYFNYGFDKVTTFKPRGDVYGFTDLGFQMFESDLGLFYSTLINTIPALRSMDTDFGILPFPKADEAQERYITRNGGGMLKLAPKHTANPERTGILMEALAAESRNTTIPAYKEINLKTKFTRDDESAEMLDIMFDNSFMELGDVIFLEDIGVVFQNEIRNNGNFTSLIEKNTARMQKVLDKINNSLGELE